MGRIIKEKLPLCRKFRAWFHLSRQGKVQSNRGLRWPWLEVIKGQDLESLGACPAIKHNLACAHLSRCCQLSEIWFIGLNSCVEIHCPGQLCLSWNDLHFYYWQWMLSKEHNLSLLHSSVSLAIAGAGHSCKAFCTSLWAIQFASTQESKCSWLEGEVTLQPGFYQPLHYNI